MNVLHERPSLQVFGIVTNMAWDGEELIHWYHKRCGKSEAAHAVMKDDLAGGRLPSADFGESAAWWRIGAPTIHFLSEFVVHQKKMTYVPEAGQVLYQSKDGQRTKVFDALEWLAAMPGVAKPCEDGCSHVPNKGESRLWRDQLLRVLQ